MQIPVYTYIYNLYITIKIYAALYNIIYAISQCTTMYMPFEHMHPIASLALSQRHCVYMQV